MRTSLVVFLSGIAAVLLGSLIVERRDLGQLPEALMFLGFLIFVFGGISYAVSKFTEQ